MNGRKLGVLMVLALLVLNVPMAFAQEGTITQHGKDITEDSHVKDTRDRALQAQSNFGDVKAKIVNNKALVARCLADSGMSGCAESLAGDVEDRKVYLDNAIGRIVAVLDNLELKAEHISDVTERDEMVQHIKDRRDALHELAQKVDGIQDREGIKAVRDEAIDLFKDARQVVNQYRTSTRIGVMHGINQKLETLNARIGHIADKLDEKGVTLGEDYPVKYENLQKAISEAESKLELAREKYQHAVELKNSGASQEEVQVAIAEGKAYLEQVKERVRTARNHVSDILQAFQTRAGSQTLTEAIAETAEE